MDFCADIWKIEGVLAIVKQADYAHFHICRLNNPDGKNALCLKQLGFTPRDVYNVVMTLEYTDYVQGPLADDKGRPHDLWVFGTFIEWLEIYIKLTVVMDAENVKAVCVSFHPSQWPLAYPYKGRKTS